MQTFCRQHNRKRPLFTLQPKITTELERGYYSLMPPDSTTERGHHSLMQSDSTIQKKGTIIHLRSQTAQQKEAISHLCSDVAQQKRLNWMVKHLHQETCDVNNTDGGRGRRGK